MSRRAASARRCEPRARRRRAASCLRGTRGTRRRRSRCSRCGRATPNFAIAATVSPPPAIENAGERGDRAAAIARVPAANASNSNTPTGPFHTIVPASAMIASSIATDRGPMSRIRSSSATSAIAFDRRCRVGREFASRTRRRPGSAPCPETLSRIARASPTRSGSASDLPMRAACGEHERVGDAAADDQRVDLARRARAGSSASSRPWSRRRSPPAAARGCASARPSASSSAASSGPAQATGAKRAMPCVVASARCAVPKASLT